MHAKPYQEEPMTGEPVLPEVNAPDMFGVLSDIEPSQTHFEVVDTDSALWCVGHIFTANSKRAAIEAQYKQWKARLDEWKAKELKGVERTEEHMMGLIQPWATREVAKAKAKHVDLPGARIGYRSTPVKAEVTDEDAVIEWARDNYPTAIRVKEEPDKKVLKKLLRDGVDVPGARLEPGMQRLYVEES